MNIPDSYCGFLQMCPFIKYDLGYLFKVEIIWPLPPLEIHPEESSQVILTIKRLGGKCYNWTGRWQ